MLPSNNFGRMDSIWTQNSFLDAKTLVFNRAFLERAAGIEPATLAWKARALPLCNARDTVATLRGSAANPYDRE